MQTNRLTLHALCALVATITVSCSNDNSSPATSSSPAADTTTPTDTAMPATAPGDSTVTAIEQCLHDAGWLAGNVTAGIASKADGNATAGLCTGALGQLKADGQAGARVVEWITPLQHLADDVEYFAALLEVNPTPSGPDVTDAAGRITDAIAELRLLLNRT